MTRLLKSEVKVVSIYLESEYIDFIIEEEYEKIAEIRRRLKDIEELEEEILNF